MRKGSVRARSGADRGREAVPGRSRGSRPRISSRCSMCRSCTAAAGTRRADDERTAGRRAVEGDQREGVRRREQRRAHAAARRTRLQGHRRARRLGADAEVLRSEQRLVRRDRGDVRAVQHRRVAPGASRRQHQLLARSAAEFVPRISSAATACGSSTGSSWHDRDQVEAFQSFIDNYVREQKKLGRFERPLNNHLTPSGRMAAA